MLEELLTETNAIIGKFTNKYCPVSGKDLTDEPNNSSGHWLMNKYGNQRVSSRSFADDWEQFEKDNPSGFYNKVGCRGFFDPSHGLVYQYTIMDGKSTVSKEIVIYDPKISRVKQNKEK